MKAFSSMHPFVLMIYFLSVLITAMFINNPIIQLSALLGGIAFCGMLTTAKQKLSDIAFYIPLFILISITNPLFSHNGETPLFFMNGNAVTLEAIAYGVFIAVMVIGVMLWCKCYSLIMTSDRFLYLFGRVLPKPAIVMSTALRYIPMLKRQSEKVKKAQRAMGFYTSESYFDRLRFSLRVYSVLIGWSMENAVETAKAMNARGFKLKHHTSYSSYKFKTIDCLLLALNIVLIVLVFFGVGSGAVAFSYYPQITHIDTSVFSLAVYSAYLILVFIPFFIEIQERIKWNCYRSKISALHTQRVKKEQ